MSRKFNEVNLDYNDGVYYKKKQSIFNNIRVTRNS